MSCIMYGRPGAGDVGKQQADGHREKDAVTKYLPLSPYDADPLVSAHARYISKNVFECGVQPLIIVVGIPGNVICCIVFVLQGLKDRIHLLLFSLAGVDLINLLSQFVPRLSCLLRWGWGDVEGADHWDSITNVYLATLSRWSGFVSGILIVVMSVDRCLSVTLPLKAARILTYRPMLATVFISYLVPLACFVPNYLVYRLVWMADPATNRSTPHFGTTDDVIPSSIPIQIIGTLTLFVKPVCVIIVVVCYLITSIMLRRASRKRVMMQEMNKSNGTLAERRITVMLLFLCVVYVILVLPELCAAWVNYFVPEFTVYGKYFNTFLVVYQVIFTASALNSSANFFAYLFLSSKFQSTLKSMCLCQQRGKTHGM
ncbi:hypothetical protein ACOMHN_033770 [Nucella lapillus]